MPAKDEITGQPHSDDGCSGSPTITAQLHTTLPRLFAAMSSTIEAPMTGRNHRGGVIAGGLGVVVIVERPSAGAA